MIQDSGDEDEPAQAEKKGRPDQPRAHSNHIRCKWSKHPQVKGRERGGPWPQGQRKGLVGPGPQRATSARTLRGAVSGRSIEQGTGNGGGSAESSGKTARLSPHTQTGCRLRTRWWCVGRTEAKSWGPRSCTAPLGDAGTGTCTPAAASVTATPGRPRATLRSRAGDSAALHCGARSAQLSARGVGRASGKGERAGFWSAGS